MYWLFLFYSFVLLFFIGICFFLVLFCFQIMTNNAVLPAFLVFCFKRVLLSVIHKNCVLQLERFFALLFPQNHLSKPSFSFPCIFLCLPFQDSIFVSFINPFWDYILVLFLLLYFLPLSFLHFCFFHSNFLTSPCQIQLVFIFVGLVLLVFIFEVCCFYDSCFSSLFVFVVGFCFVVVVSFVSIFVFVVCVYRLFCFCCVCCFGFRLWQKKKVCSLAVLVFLGIRLMPNQVWSRCSACLCWRAKIPPNMQTQSESKNGARFGPSPKMADQDALEQS